MRRRLPRTPRPRSAGNAQSRCGTIPRRKRPRFGPNSPPSTTVATGGIWKRWALGPIGNGTHFWTPGWGKHYVAEALKDPNPDLRIAGLRIARELKLDVIGDAKALAKDASAQVRRECAIALRHNPSPEAPQVWAQLATQYDGRDRWYLEALGIGADRQWDTFLDTWLGVAGEQCNMAPGREIVWRSRGRKTSEQIG